MLGAVPSSQPAANGSSCSPLPCTDAAASFILTFSPHAQVRTEFGIRRAGHCLGVACGGEGPTGRSLMLNAGEEKEQLMPILVPELCQPRMESLSAMLMVQMGRYLPEFLMGR